MSSTVTSARFVQVPSTLLSSVRGFVVGDRAPLDAVNALREIGYQLGEEVYAGLDERMARDFAGSRWTELEPAEFWRAASGFFEDRGWGAVSFEDLHPAVGVLTLASWVEGESGGGPKGCHLSVGLFSALLERLAGGGVAVMEVPSRAEGEARLLFARGDVLGRVYEGIRAGHSVEAAVAALD
jgi:hypothetical protein